MSDVPIPPPKSPSDRTAFIAEDDFFIASALESMLNDAGWSVDGPYGTLEKTLAAAQGALPDIAFIDVSLRGEHSYEAMRHFLERGVPVVICSGYNTDHLPDDLRGLPLLPKPYTDAMVLALLQRADETPKTPD